MTRHSGQLRHLQTLLSSLSQDANQNAFAGFGKRSERRLTTLRASHDGLRYPFPNVVLFSVWRIFAHPLKGHFHVGASSRVKIILDHEQTPIISIKIRIAHKA